MTTRQARRVVSRGLVVALAGGVLLSQSAVAGAVPPPLVPPDTRTEAAAPVGPRVVVGPVAMHPGGRVSVTGQGWRARTAVQVRLAGAGARVVADAAGRFTVRVLVPWQATPGMVSVTATQGTRVASTRLRVGVDWRVAGRDAARSFTNPYEKQLTKTSVTGLEVVGRLARPGTTIDNTWQNLSTVGTSGYACNLNGDVARFDLVERTLQWLYVEDNPAGVEYCSSGGAPYADGRGTVWLGQLRLDDQTGEVIHWEIRSDVTFPHGGILISGSGDYSGMPPTGIDPETGATLWQADAGDMDLVLLSSGGLYSTDGDSVYAVDPATGRNLWTRSFPTTSALASNGKVLLGLAWLGDDPLNLVRLDPDSGAVMWSVNARGGVYSPILIDADRAYLVRGVAGQFEDRNLVAYDLSGRQTWSTPMPKEWLDEARLTQANGIVYVPILGGLNTYDAATGELLSSTKVSDPQGHPIEPGTAIVDDGHVYLTSSTGIYDLTL